MPINLSRDHRIGVLLVLSLALQLPLALGGDGLAPALRTLGTVLLLGATLGLGTLLVGTSRRRVRTERGLAQVAALMAAPAHAGPALQQLAEAALALVPGASRCAIHLCDGQSRLLYAQAVAPAVTGGQSTTHDPAAQAAPDMRAAPALAIRALQEQRPLHRDELAPSQGGPVDVAGRDPTALYALPIGNGDAPLGALVLYGARDGRLEAGEEALAALVGTLAGTLLWQQRAHVSARQDPAQGELVLNALSDALLVLDHEDRVVRHNPSLAAILGPDLMDLAGQRLQVRSPDARIQRLAYLVGDTSSRTPTRRHLTIDEPIHAVLDIDITPVRDAAGQWLQVVSMHDVTVASDALDAQTHLLRATAHGLQAPLAALGDGPHIPALAQPSRQLERLRQDLLAVAEPLENLAEGAHITTPWQTLLNRIQGELPKDVARHLQVHSHPALAAQQVPDRWLGHLLLTLIEEATRRAGDGTVILDVEGRPGELVFTVRAAVPGASHDSENPLGFGASQSTLNLHVARRLATALGGYLWRAPDAEALRYQLILPVDHNRT
jgi:PAS domain-containing protein